MKGEISDRLKQLSQVVKGKRKVLIITHNNPDPDSVASAWALKYILQHYCKVSSVLVYGGIVGRSENRAMIKYLRIEVKPFREINLRNYSAIALVDTQPNAGNNPLPRSIKANIVIDHHPLRSSAKDAEYIDVRPEYGSTSSILAQYCIDFCRATGKELDKKLATALFYGIKSDTRDLGREASEEDIKSVTSLYPLLLLRVLSKIEYPKVSREYVRAIDRAFKESMVYRDALIVDIGSLSNPDMIAEMADSLLRIEGIEWVLSLGRYNSDLFFSLRTTKRKGNAGRIAITMAKGLGGSAGGHDMIAGGRFEMGRLTQEEQNELISKVRERFLKSINRQSIAPAGITEEE
jgi:nanoRNase/pAp phosphatase (c-di-AMP/oligoRNAs hydrolase)